MLLYQGTVGVGYGLISGDDDIGDAREQEGERGVVAWVRGGRVQS